MHRQILFLVPLVSLGLLAGCGSNDEADSDQSSTGPVAGGDSTNSADGSAASDSLESCLVGRWQPDFDLMRDAMGIPPEADLEISGSFVLEFKAGGDFAMDIDIDSSGVGSAGEAFDGTAKNTADGTWTAAGDEFTVTVADSQSTVKQTIDGVEQPEDTSASDFSDYFGPDKPVKVTCSATTLVLEADSDDPFPLQRQ